MVCLAMERDILTLFLKKYRLIIALPCNLCEPLISHLFCALRYWEQIVLATESFQCILLHFLMRSESTKANNKLIPVVIKAQEK